MYREKCPLLVILLVTLSLICPATSQDISSQEMEDRKTRGRVLEEKFKLLVNKLKSYELLYEDVLSKRFEVIELQNEVNQFTTSVSKISDLKENLTRHELSMNDTLLRQEQQLSKLELQLLHFENQWQTQTSQLEQLKQLWNDLGNKSIARAADVTSLEKSFMGLVDRLAKQEAENEDHKLKLNTLDETLEEAGETLKSLQDDLSTAMNKQGQLEGTLTTLQKEIAEARAAGGGGSAAVVASQTPVDTICSRFMNT